MAADAQEIQFRNEQLKSLQLASDSAAFGGALWNEGHLLRYLQSVMRAPDAALAAQIATGLAARKFGWRADQFPTLVQTGNPAHPETYLQAPPPIPQPVQTPTFDPTAPNMQQLLFEANSPGIAPPSAAVLARLSAIQQSEIARAWGVPLSMLQQANGSSAVLQALRGTPVTSTWPDQVTTTPPPAQPSAPTPSYTTTPPPVQTPAPAPIYTTMPVPSPSPAPLITTWPDQVPDKSLPVPAPAPAPATSTPAAADTIAGIPKNVLYVGAAGVGVLLLAALSRR